MAENMCWTWSGEGDDRIGTSQGAGLRSHDVRIGTGRNVNGNHRRAGGIDSGNRVGIEAGHRRPETGSENRIYEDIDGEGCSCFYAVEILSVANHYRSQPQAFEHDGGIAAQLGGIG